MMQSQSLVTLPAPARGHDGDSHFDAPPSSRDATSMGQSSASPPDTATLEPTRPIVIEAPSTNDQVATACIVEVPESPVQDSLPEVAMLAQEPAPIVSVHPLAALGLQAPHAANQRPDHELPPESSNESTLPKPHHRQERTTLMGLTADSETAAFEPAPPLTALEHESEPPRGIDAEPPTTPIAPEPAPSVAAAGEIPEPTSSPELTPPLAIEAATAAAAASLEPAPPLVITATPSAFDAPDGPTSPIAFEAPPIEDRPPLAPRESRTSTIPPSGGVVPLASVLRKSDPPPVPTADNLAESVAATISAEMLTKMGPDIQARIVELVAQRVAAAVAQQVLESMTHPSLPATRPKPSRAPVAKIVDSEIPEEPAAPKRQRKRVAKH
jgi:hypothetical protein